MNRIVKARVLPLPLGRDRRVIVISDVHGKRAWLQGLLERVGFGSDDVLILLGDLVERGEESLSTLRYAMELCRRGNVYLVTGNCDTLLLDAAAGEPYLAHWLRYHPESVILQLAAEGGFAYRGAKDLPALGAFLMEHYPEELHFLNESPTIVESEHFVFVHGGVPSQDHMEGLDAWRCMKNDDFMGQGHAFSKYCVVGHWPTSLYCTEIPCCDPIVDHERRIISIDGGCGVKPSGQLNALILPHGESRDFSWVRYDDAPVRTALDHQAGSANPVTLRWPDNFVEILERGAEHTLCRHSATGRIFTAPTAYLRRREGRDYCEDVTDYRLGVAPGDRLSVLQPTGEGALVKKDGVIGWYLGRFGEETDEIGENSPESR